VGLLGLSAREFCSFVYFALVENADDEQRAEIDVQLTGPVSRSDPDRAAAIRAAMGDLA
jgi:hypothetical protein